MSSKLKRKRQTQRLMRELEAESAAKANAIASARDLSNNLVAEVNHSRNLASQDNQQQRHFERDYKPVAVPVKGEEVVPDPFAPIGLQHGKSRIYAL